MPPIGRRAFLGAAGGLLVGCAPPTSGQGPTTSAGGASVTGERVTRLSYGSHPSQFADLYRPTGPILPEIAVIIHGGFWRAAYGADQGESLASDLAARGYHALNLEYRRVGDGGGWPATFDDVAAGIDLLATIDGLDASRVVPIGHSAGGQLAVWSAARSGLPAGSPGADPQVQPTGAISLGGVLDLTTAADTALGDDAAAELIGGTPAEFPERYALADPIRRVPLGVPTVAVHARDDDLVPIGYSEAFVAVATAAGDRSRLVEVDGGHFTVVDATATAWQRVVDEFAALVG